MTTYATAIRDAIYDRVSLLPGYTFQRQPIPTLSEEDLPTLTVWIVNESLVPDGDANAAEPKFEATSTIAVSVVRGLQDPSVLDGQIDADVDVIEELLLTDPTFVNHSPDNPAAFESVRGITRRRVYPPHGDTFLCELRLEFQFFNRISYPPVVTDDLATVAVTATVVESNRPQPVVARFSIPIGP